MVSNAIYNPTDTYNVIATYLLSSGEIECIMRKEIPGTGDTVFHCLFYRFSPVLSKLDPVGICKTVYFALKGDTHFKTAIGE